MKSYEISRFPLPYPSISIHIPLIPFNPSILWLVHWVHCSFIVAEQLPKPPEERGCCEGVEHLRIQMEELRTVVAFGGFRSSHWDDFQAAKR